MAKFELNIYGNDDEILNTYATDRVRWGVFLQALEVEKGLKSKSAGDKLATINEFVKKIFPDLTDAELENADVDDVMNVFAQLLQKANKMGINSKNAEGAE